MESQALEQCLSKCISTYLQPCVPGTTLEEVLSIVHNADLYPKDIAPVVINNQAYEQSILRIDFLQAKIKDWISESPEGQANYSKILGRIFTLLGKQASRNLVACIRINKLLGVLPKKEQERMALMPKEQLKHGIAAEEFCQNRDYAFSDFAFIGGLHFDLLFAAMTKAKASRDALTAFSTQWVESLRAAHFAYEIASRQNSFKWNDRLFSAALCMGIGKLLMITLYPKELGAKSWLGFLAECEKLKFGRWIHFQTQESKRFDVTHSELSSLVVSYSHFLTPIEKAIRYYQDPYFLKKLEPDLFRVSAICNLSSALSMGQPFDEGHRRLQKEIGLTDDQIKTITTKVLSK